MRESIMKITSKKPKKQRKALFSAKNHQLSKLCSCRLADFLKSEYGVKALPIKVGDSCRITKGEYKDFEGSVIEVNRRKQSLKLKEAVFNKTDGTEFHPNIKICNCILTKFGKEGKKMDGWRAQMIERKAGFALFEEELTAPKKEKGKE